MIVILHLLKWRFQPERRTESWRRSIVEQRLTVASLLTAEPALSARLGSTLERAYPRARRKAGEEMRLPSRRLPASCPFTIEQVLDPAFWPQAEQG